MQALVRGFDYNRQQYCAVDMTAKLVENTPDWPPCRFATLHKWDPGPQWSTHEMQQQNQSSLAQDGNVGGGTVHLPEVAPTNCQRRRDPAAHFICQSCISASREIGAAQKKSWWHRKIHHRVWLSSTARDDNDNNQIYCLMKSRTNTILFRDLHDIAKRNPRSNSDSRTSSQRRLMFYDLMLEALDYDIHVTLEPNLASFVQVWNNCML